MTKRTLTSGIVGLLLSLIAAKVGYATPASMTVTGSTNQPIGHYEFCKQYVDECRATDDRAPLVLDEANWQQILNINYTVNSSIEPMTDNEIYGVEERWTFPDSVGDCEDYVLLKRKLLMEAGISPSDLLITVVLQPNGEGHAVLTVRTDRGDFVLDNMRSKVLLWSETDYRFLKRQSERNAGKWVKLQDGRATAVGSVQK